MNKRQREIAKVILDEEEDVIEELKRHYKEALEEIDQTIKDLIGNTTLDELTASQVYQIQFQENLRRKIEEAFGKLSDNNYSTIQAYLENQYANGFIGSQYVMNGQGIPFTMKLNEEAMLKAIKTPNSGFKLSDRLYSNVEQLKNNVRNEITRGIATGASYGDIARNVSNVSNIDFNKAMRIARTEGGRMSNVARNEAMLEASKNGAHVVKQWSAVLDGRTRPSHQAIDGEIVGLNEPFSNGLMFPNDPSGPPEEVINCRCECLERAEWALEDDRMKWNSETNSVVTIKASDYEDYKNQFFESVNKK